MTNQDPWAEKKSAALGLPRIVEAPAMLLAGLRRHHKIVDAATTVPAQWLEFRTSGFRDSRAPRAFGVFCSADDVGFEYMAALEVETFEGLSPSVGKMRVPAQQYAVFQIDDNASNAGAYWQLIMREWLPNSEYEDAVTPAFELYDDRFDPETGNGGFEIWFPIS